jgi:predicted amidohydrolase YtcJ
LGKKFEHDFLTLRCVKILSDGSLGARTAALNKPYADDPSTRGILNYTIAELKTHVKKADKAGFQVSVHVIGDLAAAETLRAFEETFSKDIIVKHRHRIEHASVLNPNLIELIYKAGLLVCVQPHFVVSDFWLSERLGPRRARWAYPFKSMMKRGILLAGSSDAPAEQLNPLSGIWAAVTRKSFPQERLSVEEALKLYTINAAYMSFEENVKGSIEVGKLADLTVLSDNPLEIQPDKILDIKVEMTIVGGNVVYSTVN